MKAVCTLFALAVLGTAHAEDAATAAEAGTEESVEIEAQDRAAVREDRRAERQERLAAAKESMEEAIAQTIEAAQEMAEIQGRRIRHGGHCVACNADRAFLGVLISEQGEHGITVAGLSPEGGAEKAGVVEDDVIVAINGESLVGAEAPVDVLHEILEDLAPGDAVELVVLRDDETIPLEVVTTAPVSDFRLAARRLERVGRDFGRDFDFEWRERRPGRLDRRERDGLRLADIGEDLGDYFGVDAGVLVLDTPAKSAFMPGDILKRIDGAAVSSAADGHRLLRRLTEDAQAEVRRKNRKVMVDVSPPPKRERRRVVFVDEEDEEHEYDE